MNIELLEEILPPTFLDFFEIKCCKKLGNIESKQLEFMIYLDEKNSLPKGCKETDYESKGFLPLSKIQDFPIRGKAVYLLIRRRRWRHKHTRKEVSNDYCFIAEGSRLTKELSDFLKGTGRDPSRYDK